MNLYYVPETDENTYSVYQPEVYELAKIVSIEQWGDIGWKSMTGMFICSKNLEHYNATDTPNISDVQSTTHMFAFSSFDGNISDWNTSSVKSMDGMFQGTSEFNSSINNWDTSNVEDISLMFSGAKSFNQSINNWDTSNVTDMSNVFEETDKYNQPLNNWDVSNVTNMRGMFKDSKSFNGNISDFCIFIRYIEH